MDLRPELGAFSVHEMILSAAVQIRTDATEHKLAANMETACNSKPFQDQTQQLENRLAGSGSSVNCAVAA
jgi:hypothetical protein